MPGTNENTDSEYYFDQALRLSTEPRLEEAISYVSAALESNPYHLQSLVLAGDIYVLHYDDLGMNEDTACKMALDFYERAIHVERRLAEAWEGKARALVHLQRFGEALCAAEEGLKVLPMRIGIENDVIYTNIAESLFEDKVQALFNLGRREEARKTLSEGLQYCPSSSYLSHLIDQFAPCVNDSQQNEAS